MTTRPTTLNNDIENQTQHLPTAPDYQIYLVGGAVRDALLGLPVKDQDWLIVGATPALLTAQGYQQVGNDFPVFLHPQTREEYALARTERKQGVGYNGFICDFAPEVTLEQDLSRRDLTINALAQSADGTIHDFYGGQADLKQRLLRHVSPAFSEDPLRVLRVARFAARFHNLGFKIAPETHKLMQEMTACGELTHLTAERVWLETQKAFATESPQVYFQVLREIGALKVLFPEVDALFGVPQPPHHHPEIDSGVHTLMVIEQAKKFAPQANDPTSLLFSALCHDLGKALTPVDLLPKHHGHEQKGVPPTANLANRLKVPTHTKDFAKLVTQYHTHLHKIHELRPETVIKLFNALDVWRKPERFQDFMFACEADTKGRLGFENRAYPQRHYANTLYQIARQITAQSVIQDGFEGAAIRAELDKRRQYALKQFKKGTTMTPQEIIQFWFEEITPAEWFGKSDEFDALIRQRFEAVAEAAAKSELADWRSTLEGRLAEIIVLDQFSRNLWRDTPKAFAQDPMALALAQEAVNHPDYANLPAIKRKFILMPYMHSESALIHAQAVALFKALDDDYTFDYELRHKEIIDRFGRYPHRNGILQRQSTPEEIAFLSQPNSSF